MSGCTHKSFGEHLTYLVYGLRYWFDIVCAVVANYNKNIFKPNSMDKRSHWA